jgi:hypothetical protein
MLWDRSRYRLHKKTSLLLSSFLEGLLILVTLLGA